MIMDILPNLELYQKNIPYFAQISDFLRSDFSRLQLGRHKIYDENVYALVTEFFTVSENKSVWESHRKYLDLHIVVAGTEKIYWNTVGALVNSKPYDEDKDCVLYFGEAMQSALLCPNYFVLFYPEDAHKMKCMIHSPEVIRKIVVKIKLPYG